MSLDYCLNYPELSWLPFYLYLCINDCSTSYCSQLYIIDGKGSQPKIFHDLFLVCYGDGFLYAMEMVSCMVWRPRNKYLIRIEQCASAILPLNILAC